MVRKVSRLLVAVVGSVLVALAPAAAVHAAPAAAAAQAVSKAAAQAVPKGVPGYAAPKAPPAGVDISGEGLTEPLRLRADTDASPHVVAVIDQVNWFGSAGGIATPKPAGLGPKYTVVVLAGDAPKQTFDLYPLAEGGPRAFRPAKQPDGRAVKASWFLGRLNMSETLRTAGVPLPRQVETVSGGVGGGERMLPDEVVNPGRDLDEALSELQRLLLLNAGVVVTITLGLAGIALLIRRRTR